MNVYCFDSVTSSPLESPTATHTIEDQLRSLKVDVANYPITGSRVGDSGYLSFQGLPCTGLITPVNTLEYTSQIAETELGEDSLCDIIDKTKMQKNDQDILFEKKASDTSNFRLKTTVLASSIDESMMSTCSSLWGEDRELNTTGIDNWEVPSTQILEHLSNMDSKGSHRSEIQLRLEKSVADRSLGDGIK